MNLKCCWLLTSWCNAWMLHVVGHFSFLPREGFESWQERKQETVRRTVPVYGIRSVVMSQSVVPLPPWSIIHHSHWWIMPHFSFLISHFSFSLHHTVHHTSYSLIIMTDLVLNRGNANTVQTKESNGYLLKEMLIGSSTRITNYAELKHGQQMKSWKEVSAALNTLLPTVIHNSAIKILGPLRCFLPPSA